MAETNQIQCPNCGQPYAVRADQWAQYHGRTINCTKCGKSFTVTAPPEALAPPVQAAPTAPVSYATPPSVPGGYVDPMMYPPGEPGKNGFALASFLTSIFLFCLPVIGGITAIVLGIIGLTRTRDPRVGRKGMAIAGISIGGVSILATPVIFMLIAILLPALNRAREQANRVKCASNMRQLGQAMMMYANTNANHYPDKLEDLLQVDPSMSRTVFICPSDDKTPPSATSVQTAAHEISTGQNCSYVYVGNELTTAASPDTVLLYEPLSDHRQQGINVLFADGHVEWFPAASAKDIIAQEAAGKRPIRMPP